MTQMIKGDSRGNCSKGYALKKVSPRGNSNHDSVFRIDIDRISTRDAFGVHAPLCGTPQASLGIFGPNSGYIVSETQADTCFAI